MFLQGRKSRKADSHLEGEYTRALILLHAQLSESTCALKRNLSTKKASIKSKSHLQKS